MPGNPLILVATRNTGKFNEIGEILSGIPARLVSLSDFPAIPDIIEDGATLRENAIIKAKTGFTLTGLPALADDSGLEVDALGGEPGVRSARFAGEAATFEQNNEKLLRMLSRTAAEDRTARFVCVASFFDGRREHMATGVCEGRIAARSRGRGGFGYDPLFIPLGERRTFGELPAAVKNDRSHRASAFRQMREFLSGYFNRPG